jgi:apolipoprotein D and lipocalin family protein
MFTVYNIVAYQAAWFACVLGAAYGMPWVGAAVCFAVVAAHLALTQQRAVKLKLIGAAILVGLLVDTALLRSGHLWFVSGTWPKGIAPYWMLSLWAAFATTFNHSLRWVVSRLWVSTLLGAIGGPLAYLAGAKLGALHIAAPQTALPMIGVAWGLAMLALSIVSARLQPTAVPKAVTATALGTILMSTLGACQSAHTPIATAPRVELDRFMGDWYVIANIPTFIERGAHNAVESYRLDSDGSIDTTFTFNKGAFDGPARKYTPRGFVRDKQTNAVWGMQFIWPIKADYRIVYVSPNYEQTVVGREARDYVWIMARTPEIADSDYQALLAIVQREGYDVGKLQRVPQRWKNNENAHTR